MKGYKVASKIRRQQLKFKKLRFYNQNNKEINTLAQSDKDWRDEEVRSFVERARQDIGYSQTTAPCDIYSALVSLTPTWAKRRKQWIRSSSSQKTE
jgi:hypothetical protein